MIYKFKSIVKLKFKKLSEKAVTPAYSKIGDAGLDLTATSIKETPEYIQYGTDIAVEIPEGHVGFLCSRSSVTDLSLLLKNSVGVIDSNYRGELKLRFWATPDLKRFNDSSLKLKYGSNKYNVGDRVGQLIIVPIPHIEMEQVEELSESNRGENGYGSTGK